MNTTQSREPLAALFLIGPDCPHCAAELDVLTGLVKTGELSQLQLINVAVEPKFATDLGVRSVPWLKLGVFELEGAQTAKQIMHWIALANSPTGITDYVEFLLVNGNLTKAIKLMHENTTYIEQLISLAGSTVLDMKVQLGISAVMEEFEGTVTLKNSINKIAELANHLNSQVRTQAAHFLSLTKCKDAIPYLNTLSKDKNSEVREVAEEGLLDIQT